MEIGQSKCNCQSQSRGSLEALVKGGLQAEYAALRLRLLRRMTLFGLLFIVLLQGGRALHSLFAQYPDGTLYEFLLSLALALPLVIILYKNTFFSAPLRSQPESAFQPELVLGIFLRSFWSSFSKK